MSRVTIEEMARGSARVPLRAQPGEAWYYSNTNPLVLAAIVEKVSGKRFDVYLQEDIFEPLKMVDTHFITPKQKWDRVTGLYYSANRKNGKKGDVYIAEPGEGGQKTAVQFPFDTERTLYSSAGGLVSTASDFFRLMQMLLNGGDLDEARILSSQAVKLMTQNQIGGLSNNFTGHGWGYFVTVQTNDAPPDKGFSFGGKGAYGWIGLSGTITYANPSRDTVIVFMTHIWNFVPGLKTYMARIPNVVNAAITDD
jgi:CubicO group peptidase (beta-lactamase class C family)